MYVLLFCMNKILHQRFHENPIYLLRVPGNTYGGTIYDLFSYNYKEFGVQSILKAKFNWPVL